MMSNLIVCITALLLIVITASSVSARLQQIKTYGECKTHIGYLGSCIPLEQCRSAYNLLRKKPLLDGDRKFLRRIQCGSDKGKVLVCCSEKHVTAQSSRPIPVSLPKSSICGDQASCIQLEKCTFLFNMLFKTPLLDEDRQFLSRHQCGSNNGKIFVCCRDEYITRKQPKAPTSGLLPIPGICGYEMSDRVVGGSVARIRDLPWMALILYDGGHRCGGSLINDRYILTAAHCIKRVDQPLRPVLVRLGEWNTLTDPDCARSSNNTEECADRHVDIPIESIITHPNYAPTSTSRSVPADIALLRLSRRIKYSDFIRPICLPIRDNLRDISYDGVAMDIAGWGLTEKNVTSNLKMRAVVHGVPLNGCQVLYGRTFNVQLDNSQICAGGQRGVDTCTGDSGGALVALDASNRSLLYHYAAGVISFGPTPCGMQGWPGVYTKVSNYVDWIRENIQP